MADQRVAKLAKILVHHSTKVKRGDTVMINASTELAKPLVLEVYREVVKAGGHPIMNVGFEEAHNIFFKGATKAQLEHLSKIKLYEAKNIDCVISIAAPLNKKSMSNIDPKKAGIRSKALRKVRDIIVNEKRWVICNFPTNALAQEADMSLATLNLDKVTGDSEILLDLTIGHIIIKTDPLKGKSKFEVLTPTSMTAVRGTGFEVIVKRRESPLTNAETIQ